MGSCITYLLSFLIACSRFSHAISDYIVYMGSLPNDVSYSPSSHHLKILRSVLDQGSTSAENYMIRSYYNSFNGFVAKITETEKQRLSDLEDVVSVFPDGIMKVQTTRSWDFMGFPESVKRNKMEESDIIIGVLDTGIWPESESFNDQGLGPIPSKWKGVCQKSNSFRCNKKLIGARTLETMTATGNNSKSARDTNGHGTHTASTAAGAMVDGASFYGVAKGTARGAVPSSRIAAYKVCSENGTCKDSDLLAGFDIAIKDGVDIISVSIGSSEPRPFDTDSIAIGSFHAMDKAGILTLQSAGNVGAFGTVSSVAPWLFCVAASSIDRRIVSNTILANGRTFIGNAVNSNTLEEKNYTLVFGKDATSSCSATEGSWCKGGCLDSKLVKGKIVVCDQPSFFLDEEDDDVAFLPSGVNEANRAGAVGAITISQVANLSRVSSLTTSYLENDDFFKVKSYYNQTKSRLGYIQKTESLLSDSSAPIITSFSSKGPNRIAPDILKPDVSAPGLNILAAFSPKSPPSQYSGDKRSVKFNILSGTSMSCPHASGASAYVKSFHPTWSPSAIKSALMTTAREMSLENNPDGEFGYGSGHIDPAKAVDPGLVYESSTKDYMDFLCKQGYNATVIKKITEHNTTGCSSNATVNATSSSTPADLNYPSMAARIRSNSSQVKFVFRRTVTNVGFPNSTYTANITNWSPKLRVMVEPTTLSFESLNQKKSFSVSVVGVGTIKAAGSERSSLTWFDGFHKVRSPIVIYKDFQK
ncbi:hypothetical protein V2J09_007437 [Rumex salicifolius]